MYCPFITYRNDSDDEDDMDEAPLNSEENVERILDILEGEITSELDL